jgi:hypothetical protein
VREILKKRLEKLNKHYEALKEYHNYIKNIDQSLFDRYQFHTLSVEERGVLEAYLKRFASIQDYLGSKIFPYLLNISGITFSKMSEALTLIEKEGIIDFDEWITFREIRNELEHDYPDDLDEALKDLKFCIDNFEKMEEILKKVFQFAKRYKIEI